MKDFEWKLREKASKKLTACFRESIHMSFQDFFKKMFVNAFMGRLFITYAIKFLAFFDPTYPQLANLLASKLISWQMSAALWQA